MLVGDAVVDAVVLDVFGGLAPAREASRVFGWRAEFAEVRGRVGDVGVDELAEAKVDRVLDTRELLHFVVMFLEVLADVRVVLRGRCSIAWSSPSIALV